MSLEHRLDGLRKLVLRLEAEYSALEKEEEDRLKEEYDEQVPFLSCPGASPLSVIVPSGTTPCVVLSQT